MHGRLKVKTSVQEQEEKRIEREKKLNIYRAGFDSASKKRVNGEYDEEILHITEQLLYGNPDVYTLWNIRKETLKLFRESKSEHEYEKILEDELRVTEAALRPNPKSYGAWHHRMWIFQSMQKPPISRDLSLCERLLKADPRNFHCWDYRRWLSMNLCSGNKDEVELQFSHNKLQENFSNYSAWHYRSLFLPKVYWEKGSPCSITATQHKKELELVQSAVFTDPEDQSAWFYLRWLFGKGILGEPRLRMGTVRSRKGLLVSASLAMTMAQTPRVFDGRSGFNAQLRIGERVVKGHWECSGLLKRSHVWTFVPEEEIVVTTKQLPSIAYVCGDDDVDLLLLKEHENYDDVIEGEEEWFGAREDEDEGNLSSQEQMLELCSQLLELEPESRWTLLTAVHLMKELESRKPQQNASVYRKKILEYLDKLEEVDPLRSGYYSDLRSNFVLKNAFSRVQPTLDMSSLCPTSLPSPMEPLPLGLLLASRLNLSCDQLALPKVRPGALLCLAHLPRLRHLTLAAYFHKLESESSSVDMEEILPRMPQLISLELIPRLDEDDSAAVIPKTIIEKLYKLMPGLQSLKPI